MTARIRWAAALAFFVGAHASHAATTLANVNPVAVDFGAVKMGATVSVPVTIQNLSNAQVGIANGGISGTNLFTTDGATCAQANYQLAPGASCYFTFTFTPGDASGTVSSTRAAILVQTANITQAVLVGFSGSGTETLAQLSPVSIDFGNIFIGQRVTVPVTVVNTHAQPLTFAGGGIFAGNPAFDAGGKCPSSLAAGATCTFEYSFTPANDGPVETSTAITVSASQPVSMSEYFPIALRGTGVSTVATPNTASWPVVFDFGLTKVGHANTVFVYYQNNSSADVSPSGGGFNDTQGGVFGAYSSGGANCNTPSIPSGATCTNQYVFQPREAKSYSASTSSTLSNNTGSNFYPLSVTGTGVGTLARVSPPTVDLGTVAFDSSASVPVVVTNTSDAPLTNFTGGQATPPFATTTTCGASLAVGASCAYLYTFNTPSPQNSLKATYTASTLLTFTNASGIQPIVPIKITAHVADRIFGDGLEGG